MNLPILFSNMSLQIEPNDGITPRLTSSTKGETSVCYSHFKYRRPGHTIGHMPKILSVTPETFLHEMELPHSTQQSSVCHLRRAFQYSKHVTAWTVSTLKMSKLLSSVTSACNLHYYHAVLPKQECIFSFLNITPLTQQIKLKANLWSQNSYVRFGKFKAAAERTYVTLMISLW